MPFYDYKCTKCQYLFEVEQRINDPKLEFCPKCKGKVERLIAPVGIIFKGSGFYVTDSKKDKNKAKAPSAGSAASANDFSKKQTDTNKTTSSKSVKGKLK